jgi:hypothetical protein
MSKLAIDANAKPIQVMRPATNQVVSVTATSAQSTAVPVDCRVIRIVSTVACYYTLDSATATNQSIFLPANSLEFLHVYAGDQVAVISDGTDGSMFITEMY